MDPTKLGKKYQCFRRIIAVILLGFISTVANTLVAHATESGLKAVMQMNSKDLDVVIRGLRNTLEITEEAQKQNMSVDVKVVVSGPALDNFVKGGSEQLNETFQKLNKLPNVHFLACSRTLERIHKTMKSLLPGFTVVPDGPYEVLNAEKEGYLYVKP
jgi:intracellular sulfur oxidation DsrE/DsrF family protein